ncbi:MAG TPA: hypothetical protein VKA27_06130 [Sunxiuqinia sp.]|nr:hypothetical protein [Sunxiuqinia sp.]
MNLLDLKRVLLLGAMIGLLSSCQTKADLKFNYKISGNLQTTLVRLESPISKTNSNYRKKRNKIVRISSIKKLKPFSSFVKRDSMFTTKTINGKSSESYTITNTRFERDTFFKLTEEESGTNYFVSGKVNAKILSVENSDSLQFILSGTFQDTIQVSNATGGNSEKITQYLISQDLLKHLQNETKKMTDKIAIR